MNKPCTNKQVWREEDRDIDLKSIIGYICTLELPPQNNPLNDTIESR